MLDVTDPTGDDNGPGTYQYPTASDFVAGSFDLTRFQVLRATAPTPTSGSRWPTWSRRSAALDGAQLLDVYVHVPGG